MKIKTRKSTPWGVSDYAREIADGIVCHGTPSHGGIHLSPARQRVVRQLFPRFETFAGGAWYEEDCDWAVVVVAFPDDHDPKSLRGAVRMILGMKGQGNNGEWLTGTSGWPHVAEWLTGTSQGREILDRVARTEEELRGQWEVGSMGSPGGNEYPENCWSVGLTQVGTDERKQVIFSEYPGEIFYTNEEVTRLTYRK